MLAADIEVVRTRRNDRFGYLWGFTRAFRNKMTASEFNTLVADIKASLVRDLSESGFEPSMGTFRLHSETAPNDTSTIMYEVSVRADRRA